MTGSAPGPPFAQASPAEVRAALILEDTIAFDLDRQRPDQVAMLDTWRRVAWVTASIGPQRYRETLTSAGPADRQGTTRAATSRGRSAVEYHS
jgi:hypothetical protein